MWNILTLALSAFSTTSRSSRRGKIHKNVHNSNLPRQNLMSISNSTAPAHGQRKTAEHALYNVCFSQSAVFPPCRSSHACKSKMAAHLCAMVEFHTRNPAFYSIKRPFKGWKIFRKHLKKCMAIPSNFTRTELGFY